MIILTLHKQVLKHDQALETLKPKRFTSPTANTKHIRDNNPNTPSS
jgi:hypothetical protein